MKPEFTFTANEIDEGRFMAALSYLTIIGYIIAYLMKRNNRFLRYHAQQSMALIIMTPLVMIPVLGWILACLIIVFSILGAVNAFSGKAKPLPVFGSLGYRFELLLPEHSNRTCDT